MFKKKLILFKKRRIFQTIRFFELFNFKLNQFSMQNFKNHRRLYPAHHFILIPLLLTLLIWAIQNFVKNGFSFPNFYFVLSSFVLVLIALISRTYAMKNQDRLIRIEMRYRYFELTGKSFAEKEKQLKLGQVIALRFACDEELIILIEKAISEKLTSTEIKKAITNWLPDNNRV